MTRNFPGHEGGGDRREDRLAAVLPGSGEGTTATTVRTRSAEVEDDASAREVFRRDDVSVPDYDAAVRHEGDQYDTLCGTEKICTALSTVQSGRTARRGSVRHAVRFGGGQYGTEGTLYRVVGSVRHGMQYGVG